jgi:hypothetical protein
MDPARKLSPLPEAGGVTHIEYEEPISQRTQAILEAVAKVEKQITELQ